MTPRRWPDAVALALVVLGAAIRVRQWAGGRSLWLDEAFLAQSLTTRGPVELVTQPLEYSQSAPLGWLLAERAVIAAVGSSERGLRLLPLLLGLAALPLVWALARRVLPAATVPLAVGVVALSPSLVYYSNELKPYSADVAVFLLLLWLASRRSLVALTVAGAVGVWLSTASLLALAGIGTVLVLSAGGVRAAVRTAVTLLPWAVSAAAAALAVRGLQRNELLLDYWDFSFPRGAGDLPAWLVRTGESLVDSPLELGPAWLVLLVALVGAVHLAVRRRVETALVLAVLAAGVLGAALSAYPLHSRLALWTVPLVALLLAGALPGRATRRTAAWLAVSAVAFGVVVAPLVRDGLPLLVDRTDSQELRPVLTQLVDELQPGDVVLVDRSARAATRYYADRLDGLEPAGALGFAAADGGCADAEALREAGFGERRVWVVFSHQSPSGVSRASLVELPRRIEALATLQRRIEAPGASALLFAPRAEPVEVAPDDPARCVVLLPLAD